MRESKRRKLNFIGAQVGANSRLEEGLVQELLHANLIALGYPVFFLSNQDEFLWNRGRDILNLVAHEVMRSTFVSFGYSEERFLGRSEPLKEDGQRVVSDLRGAEFWDAHLENTDFWGAHLEGADLWDARLNRAKFEEASLERANMKGTTLSGTILTSACMTGANLEGADLSQAIGLTKEQGNSAFSQGAGASLPPSLLA